MSKKLVFKEDYCNKEEYKAFREFLRKPQVPVEQTNSTYRMIHYWDKEGLFETLRSEQKGWRKFSVVDLVWISIIKELRSYGFPIKKIKEVYKHMFRSKIPPLDYEPNLEFQVYLTFAKNPISLVVFPNGSSYFIRDYQDPMKVINDLISLNNSTSLILLDLNNIVQQILKQLDFTPIFMESHFLDEKEEKLLGLLNRNDIEELKVIFRDKKPLIYQYKEVVENNARIISLLRDAAFQTIEIKTENGKVVKLERFIKEKL